MKIVIHKRFETRILCSVTKINKTRCWLKQDVRRDFIHNHCCNGEEEDPAWTEINFTEAKGWRLFKIGGARGEDSTLCQIPGGHSGNLGRGVKPESIVHWVSPRPEQAHENFTTTSVRWIHKILNMVQAECHHPLLQNRKAQPCLNTLFRIIICGSCLSSMFVDSTWGGKKESWLGITQTQLQNLSFIYRSLLVQFQLKHLKSVNLYFHPCLLYLILKYKEQQLFQRVLVRIKRCGAYI